MEHVVYYIIYRAQQEGPFSLEQLHELISTGQIAPEQPGCCTGMSEWRPLNEFLPPPLPKAASPSPALPAPPVATPVQSIAKKSSKIWLWVTLTIVVVLAGIGALIGYGVHALMKNGTAAMAFMPLPEERAGHEIQWKPSNLKSTGPADQPDGKNFLLTRYHSPVVELSAYLTPDPKDSKKHPAIVWAHSFSRGISNSFWQPTEDGYNLTARAFREKGIVMMCPSWRGENGNPGRIELLYGEVDDFLAAIEHVKKLPYVDPQRVYIGGHNTGGTLTLLAASATDQFCAAFSVGGMLDGVAALKKSKRDELPFHPESERDFQLRNPMRYAAFIRRPLFYFEADVHFDKNAAGQMQSRANKYFQAFHLEGTHFDILHPVTQLIAEKIASNSELKFSEEELIKSYRLADFNDREALLSSPSKDDHGLSAVLAKAETGAGSQIKLSVSDVKIIQNALMVFNEQKDCSPKTMATVVKLANLRGMNMASRVVHEFDLALAHWFSEWAMLRLKDPGKLTKEEEEGLFDIVSAVAFTPLSTATDLVVAAMRRGIMADKKLSWLNLILNAYNFKGSQTEYFLRSFTGDPPSGQMAEILLSFTSHLLQQGWEGANPFNHRKGFAILKAWVESKKTEDYINAYSAVRAAVCIDAEFRDELIDLAFEHADKRIRVLAAWAEAKNGGSRGIPLLKQACLDTDVSVAAQDYLKSLLREDEIPPEAKDTKNENMAKAVISQSLMDPSQLGERPSSIDVYDNRTIFWPPTQEKCEFWLLKFTFQPKDGTAPKTGYGCYSKPVTWYNCKGNMKSDIPEDLYLYTCASEYMQSSKRRGKPITMDEANAKALVALRQHNPGVFDQLKLPSLPK